MSTKRFSLNSSRTSKQGSLINVGKESEEYKALTNTMTMAAEDMAEIGLAEGQMALIRTEFGEAEFKCAAGKIPLDVAAADIDLLSFSAHKLYGPQGIGALHVRSAPPTRLAPLMHGGGQQRGLRPGTIPLALAAGFGIACRVAKERMEQDRRRLMTCQSTSLIVHS